MVKVVKSMDSRDELTEFEAYLNHLESRWPWEYFWIHLCSNFIYVREILQVYTEEDCYD